MSRLKNKNILITAGPTWVAIDKVRVISNIATGQTGLCLAKQARKREAKVTLILGPVGLVNLNSSIRVLRFKYFQELKDLLSKELRTKKYDIVIHSAAVSDYRPLKSCRGKIDSGKQSLSIRLKPTPKLFKQIKKIAPQALFTIFKYEPGLKDNLLNREAHKTLRQADADLVVANKITNRNYKAFIIDRNKQVLSRGNRSEALANKLLSIIEAKL